MRLGITSALLLLLFGCDGKADADATPSHVQVQKIERWLERQTCVGELSGWERRYQFHQDLRMRSPSYMKVSHHIIDFALRRGDAAYPIQPGLHILAAKVGFNGEIDDRPGYAAYGKFDVASGKMTLGSCGYSKGG